MIENTFKDIENNLKSQYYSHFAQIGNILLIRGSLSSKKDYEPPKEYLENGGSRKEWIGWLNKVYNVAKTLTSLTDTEKYSVENIHRFKKLLLKNEESDTPKYVIKYYDYDKEITSQEYSSNVIKQNKVTGKVREAIEWISKHFFFLFNEELYVKEIRMILKKDQKGR